MSELSILKLEVLTVKIFNSPLLEESEIESFSKSSNGRFNGLSLISSPVSAKELE